MHSAFPIKAPRAAAPRNPCRRGALAPLRPLMRKRALDARFAASRAAHEILAPIVLVSHVEGYRDVMSAPLEEWWPRQCRRPGAGSSPRHQAGWPQAHIAKAMGVSRKCVMNWIDR